MIMTDFQVHWRFWKNCFECESAEHLFMCVCVCVCVCVFYPHSTFFGPVRLTSLSSSTSEASPWLEVVEEKGEKPQQLAFRGHFSSSNSGKGLHLLPCVETRGQVLVISANLAQAPSHGGRRSANLVQLSPDTPTAQIGWQLLLCNPPFGTVTVLSLSATVASWHPTGAPLAESRSGTLSCNPAEVYHVPKTDSLCFPPPSVFRLE